MKLLFIILGFYLIGWISTGNYTWDDDTSRIYTQEESQVINTAW